MVGFLKNDYYIILYAKPFLYFELTLMEINLSRDNFIESPEFNMGEESPSCIIFKTDSIGTTFLYLRHAKWMENGRYVTNIFDKTGSSIETRIRFTDPKITSTCIDLISNLSQHSISVAQYPITITCTARALNSTLLKESIDIFESSARQLCSDFKTVLDEDISTDIVLKVDGGSIKAHKLVLVSRSPVFFKMFSHDSSETAGNAVIISDVKLSTMKKFVNFLYTAEWEKCNFDETLELYYVADKYEVLSLRDECKRELLNSIEDDNACSLFTLANQHNDEDFKQKVVKFVKENFKFVATMSNLNEMCKEDVVLLISLCAPDMKHV